MFGPMIVGFGSCNYVYKSGREGNTVVYLAGNIESDLFAKLGPHSRGVSYLYLKRLSEIDMGVLSQLVKLSMSITREQFPSQ